MKIRNIPFLLLLWVGSAAAQTVYTAAPNPSVLYVQDGSGTFSPVSALVPVPVTGSITTTPGAGEQPVNITQIAGTPVGIANPLPTFMVVAGAAVSTANPMPSLTYGLEGVTPTALGILSSVTAPFDPLLPTPSALLNMPLAFDNVAGYISILNSSSGNLHVSDGGSSLTVDYGSGTFVVDLDKIDGTAISNFVGTHDSPVPTGLLNVGGTSQDGNARRLLTSTTGAPVIAAKDAANAVVEQLAAIHGADAPTGALAVGLRDAVGDLYQLPGDGVYGLRVNGVSQNGGEVNTTTASPNGSDQSVTLPASCAGNIRSCRVCNIDAADTAKLEWNTSGGTGLTIYPAGVTTHSGPTCTNSPDALGVNVASLFSTFSAAVDLELACVCD